VLFMCTKDANGAHRARATRRDATRAPLDGMAAPRVLPHQKRRQRRLAKALVRVGGICVGAVALMTLYAQFSDDDQYYARDFTRAFRGTDVAGGIESTTGDIKLGDPTSYTDREVADGGVRCGVGGMAFGKRAWDCPSERSYPELDVVSVAVKPSCVNAVAVAALNQYIGPRRIVIVAPGAQQCELFRKMASNVECHAEDDFLDGVTKAEASKILERLYPSIVANGGADSQFVGRQLGGWYLQQLLKLGAAKSTAVKSPPLSRKFLLWDLDMIPLRRQQLFEVDPNTNVKRAVRQIGGNVIRSYDGSYEKLMQGREKMAYAVDGTSYVTHQMVVDADIMDEMLATFAEVAKPEEDTTLPPWAIAILQSLDDENLHLGFSEYGSYASYVDKHYPDMVDVEVRKNWARASGGKLGISLQRWMNHDGLCCPGPGVLNLMRSRRFQYVGHEIGHVESCAYNSPAHALSYGYDGSALRASMYSNTD
jgi:hypothetical protein